MDAYSDLDLVLVCDPADAAALAAALPALAASLGTLAAAFTGEHVGEPRLLVCLYAEDALHVDLKVAATDALDARVDDPVLLWARDGSAGAALARTRGEYPAPDPRWIEARFRTWIHYAASKVGRGEYLEAIDLPSFVRATVLGPMGLRAAGHRPARVRRIETLAPALARRLSATVAAPERASILAALRASVALYRELRDAQRARPRPGTLAERVATAWLDRIERDRVGAASPDA